MLPLPGQDSSARIGRRPIHRDKRLNVCARYATKSKRDCCDCSLDRTEGTDDPHSDRDQSDPVAIAGRVN